MVCRREQYECVGSSLRQNVLLLLGIFGIAAAHQTSHAGAWVSGVFDRMISSRSLPFLFR